MNRDGSRVKRILDTTSPLSKMINHFFGIKAIKYLMLPDCVQNFSKIGQVADCVGFSEQVFKE